MKLSKIDAQLVILTVSLIGFSAERTWEWVAVLVLAFGAFISRQIMQNERQIKQEMENERIQYLEAQAVKREAWNEERLAKVEAKIGELNTTLSVLTMRR